MKKTNIWLFLALIIGLLSIMPTTIVAQDTILIEQSLEYLQQQNYNMAIDSLEKAILLLREKAKLELKNLQFTEDEATGFGMYQTRQDGYFAQGETFLIYTEPKNYTVKVIEQGLYEIHIKEDIYILDKEGNILWGQKDFLDYHLISHAPNNEVFITNTITQDTPFPKGEYQFQLVLKDVFSQKTVEQNIEFIVE
jgi:hypothetical protein